MSLWDCFKTPVEKAYASKPLIDWFTDIPRYGCRLGVAGKLMSAESYRRVLNSGCDFVVVGRASILHHDLPELVKKDPNWKAIPTPGGLIRVFRPELGSDRSHSFSPSLFFFSEPGPPPQRRPFGRLYRIYAYIVQRFRCQLIG